MAPRHENRPILRWIVTRLARRTHTWTLASALLILAGRLSGLAAAWLVINAQTDRAITIAIAAAVFHLGSRTASTIARIDAERDLHIEVSRSLLDSDVLSPLMVEPHFALSDGIHTATDVATHTLPSLAADAVASIAAVTIMALVLTPHLLLTTTIAAAVVALVTIVLRHRIAKLHERGVVAQQDLIDVFTTTLHGRLELVAAHAEEPALDRLANVAGQYEVQAKRSAIGIAFLGRAPLAAGVIVCAAVFALDGSLTLQWTSNTKALLVLAAALPIVLNVAFGLQQVVRHIERLRPFAEVVLRPLRADVTATTTDATLAGRRDARLTRVRFEDVSFAYHQNVSTALVLEKMSVDWKGGVLLLRGPNGSGKSSVLSLMLGLRSPLSGEVLLDEQAMTKLNVRDVRTRFAFLPQRSYLGEPHTSIAEALHLLVPTATDVEMRESLRRVGLEDQPFHALLGELSIGQRQRVALARVLLRKADIVLLDEPDANLDADAIERLRAIVMDLAKDHMVAVAAHGPLLELLQGQVCVLE